MYDNPKLRFWDLIFIYAYTAERVMNAHGFIQILTVK